MLKAQKIRTRSSGVLLLTGVCLAVALMMPGSPRAADRDDGGGRRCRGLSSEPGVDPSGFPQPQVRRSHSGVLRTTLHACISTNEMLDENAQPPEVVEFHPPTFEGTIPGPTLEVQPGDKLSILLVNDLPANPTGERDSAFPHYENTLNLHTHGLTVSPLDISDNIFREMKPGTTNLIQIDIPKDHPSGTYWYHVHKHGSVTYQFLGGMAGFLIVKGGAGTLDTVPEVAAAKDVPMAFQIIRSTNDGQVVFVHEQAQQFGTFPFPTDMPGPTPEQQGLWSTYGLDGGPTVAPDGSFTGPPSRYSYTTNGIANPTLHMQPGEVQRWRLLNATDGDNLQLVLVSNVEGQEGLGLNVVAMDAITVPKTYRLEPGDPLVIGPGQRYDVMITAGKPGTYLLQTLDPNSGVVQASVSPYRDKQFPNGIDPRTRVSRHSNDFPVPCPALGDKPSDCKPGQFAYPVTLATIEVSGEAKKMDLPADPLPTPKGLPSIDTMLSRTPNAVRNVIFEICGDVPMFKPNVSLPSCGWYFAKYNAAFWGGAPFYNLEMMRDADDVGQPNPGSQDMPRVNFKKEGLFDPTQPLFPDMIAGNYEEWTVYNRSLSDHPFHLHQNHVLITKINGITLPQPEWHDTLDVPAVVCINDPGCTNPQNVNNLPPGSITFRTYFNPVTVGCFVGHCHTLDHEDLGMMQRFDILPAKGQPSGCMLDNDRAAAVPLIERLIASRSSFQICSAARQSRPISNGPTSPAN
jgi:FtsP/CotA-like multicopper oxidase with cupredoxin domain